MLRLIVNYQNKRYQISVDPETCTVKQFKERVMVACGVPVVQQKIFGLLGVESVLLARLKPTNGQQFLLFRTNAQVAVAKAQYEEPKQGDGDSAWDFLPSEVQYLVFGLLDPTSLLHCARVCTAWRDLAKDDWIWQEVVSRRWTTQKAVSPPAPSLWRSLYFEHSWLTRNWVRSNFQAHYFRGDIGRIGAVDYRTTGYSSLGEQTASSESENALLSDFDRFQNQYAAERNDSMFVASDMDRNTIVVGNLWRSEAKKTLLGHGAKIHAVAFAANHHVISADHSGHIYLWDIHRARASLPWSTTSSEFVGRRKILASPIHTLHSAHSKILSGSNAGSIVVLDLERTAYPALILNGAHESAINGFDHLDTNLFASAGQDGFAKVWDNRSGKVTTTLLADPTTLMQVKFGWEHQMWTCGTSGTRAWDLRMASVLLHPYKNPTQSMSYDGSRLLMGSDSKIFGVELGALGVPASDSSSPPTTPLNASDGPQDDDLGLRMVSFPVAHASNMFAAPAWLVALQESSLVGLDFSAKPKRIFRPDSMFQDLEDSPSDTEDN